MAYAKQKRSIKHDSWNEPPMKMFCSSSRVATVPKNALYFKKDSLPAKTKVETRVVEQRMADANTTQSLSLNSSQQGTPKSSFRNRLYSYEDVNRIFNGIWEKRKEKLCERYDAILAQKLADQRESYVEFTYAQIRQQLQGRIPSYLS